MSAPMTLERFKEIVGADAKGRALCPAHADKNPSLHVQQKDGKVVFVCRSQKCSGDAILAALKLTWADVRGTPEKTGGREPTAVHVYVDERGAPIFSVKRFDVGGKKTFAQEPSNGARGPGCMKDVRRVLYRLPQILAAAPDAPMFFVEGEKCADRLAALGFVVTTTAGGATNFKQTKREDIRAALKDRHVVILPDNDKPGRAYAETVARCLARAAASAKVLELPGLTREGDDVVDWLDAGGTRDELEQLVARAPTPRETERPTIIIGVDEHRVVDEAIAALALNGDLYQRGDELVHIVSDGDETRIRPLAPATLRERMAATAEWMTPGRKGQSAAHPPEWAVRAVYARGEWPALRRLVGISRTPTMRPDGSLITVAGYDAATAVLYAPRATYPTIPSRPSRADVADAVRVIDDLFLDFPFAAVSDHAAAVAAILAIVGRTAIEGPLPLTAVRASTPGIGKGLLVNVVALAATGSLPQLATPPTVDEEWRKSILAFARSGARVISLDNVVGPLGCGPLAAMLTTTEITDRLLGATAIVTIPMRAAWLATGNGMTLRSDVARRVVVCDLVAGEENPEDRSGFRHPDLLAHARQEHPRVAAAALTILHAYVQAGRPAHGKPALGSYDGWDGLVRGAAVWADIGDPDGGRARIRDESDDDRDALREALEAWAAVWGETPVSAAAVVAHAEARAKAHAGELAAALGAVVYGKLTARSMGGALKRLRGRLAGGLSWKPAGMMIGTRRWVVMGVNGVSGDSCSTGVGKRKSDLYVNTPNAERPGTESPDTPSAPGNGSLPRDPWVARGTADVDADDGWASGKGPPIGGHR